MHARVHICDARLRINLVDGREWLNVNDNPRCRLRLTKLRVGLTLIVGACLAVHRHREPMLPRKTHDGHDVVDGTRVQDGHRLPDQEPSKILGEALQGRRIGVQSAVERRQRHERCIQACGLRGGDPGAAQRIPGHNQCAAHEQCLEKMASVFHDVSSIVKTGRFLRDQHTPQDGVCRSCAHLRHQRHAAQPLAERYTLRHTTHGRLGSHVPRTSASGS